MLNRLSSKILNLNVLPLSVFTLYILYQTTAEVETDLARPVYLKLETIDKKIAKEIKIEK